MERILIVLDQFTLDNEFIGILAFMDIECMY